MVREGNRVHLMSVWDDGMPPEVPHDGLFSMAWNPMNILASVQKIDGLSTARRVGVDSMSPLFQQLLPIASPDAQFVGAESMMRSLRMHKTADEVACIRTSVAMAEAAMQAAVERLEPGVDGRTLRGAFEGRMAELGTSTPANEGTFRTSAPCRAGDVPKLVQLTTTDTIDEGDLVVLSAGVIQAGYEGDVGRTWRCTMRPRRGVPAVQRELHARWQAVWARLRDACVPGATGADLRDAYERSGEPLTDLPIAYSVGVGYEGTIAGSALGRDFDATQAVEAGMVLGVQAYVAGEQGGYFSLEVVHVTDDGPSVLSAMSHGPLADEQG
jgi:Xaa-Pro aminopeptidase